MDWYDFIDIAHAVLFLVSIRMVLDSISQARRRIEDVGERIKRVEESNEQLWEAITSGADAIDRNAGKMWTRLARHDDQITEMSNDIINLRSELADAKMSSTDVDPVPTEGEEDADPQ